jgi:hypothetical protein
MPWNKSFSSFSEEIKYFRTKHLPHKCQLLSSLSFYIGPNSRYVYEGIKRPILFVDGTVQLLTLVISCHNVNDIFEPKFVPEMSTPLSLPRHFRQKSVYFPQISWVKCQNTFRFRFSFDRCLSFPYSMCCYYLSIKRTAGVGFRCVIFTGLMGWKY